jgi:hypothetical protein
VEFLKLQKDHGFDRMVLETTRLLYDLYPNTQQLSKTKIFCKSVAFIQYTENALHPKEA